MPVLKDLIARVGVVAVATAAFLVSLTRPATLFTIDEAAFGGFAQLAPPVAVALYWRRTTRTGTAAGVVGSQAFYAAHLFWIGTSPAVYGGWTAGIVGMVVGLVLTVTVSAVTAAAPDEDESVYFGSAGAD